METSAVAVRREYPRITSRYAPLEYSTEQLNTLYRTYNREHSISAAAEASDIRWETAKKILEQMHCNLKRYRHPRPMTDHDITKLQRLLETTPPIHYTEMARILRKNPETTRWWVWTLLAAPSIAQEISKVPDGSR